MTYRVSRFEVLGEQARTGAGGRTATYGTRGKGGHDTASDIRYGYALLRRARQLGLEHELLQLAYLHMCQVRSGICLH